MSHLVAHTLTLELRKGSLAITVLCLQILLIGDALAEPLPEFAYMGPRIVPAVRFTLENDALAPVQSSRKTDQYYTNGWRLSWAMRPAPKGDDGTTVEASSATRYIVAKSLGVAQFACEKVLSCSLDAGTPLDLNTSIGDVKDAPTIVDFSWNFYQLMYTPKDIVSTTYQPYDRPFAGYLALGPEIIIVDKPKMMVHRLYADVGIMGPSSASQETQALVHTLTGGRENDGWINQVKPRLGILLRYQGAFSIWAQDAIFRQPNLSTYLELTPTVSVGNVFVNAGIGLGIRLGRNLPYVDYQAIPTLDAGGTGMNKPVAGSQAPTRVPVPVDGRDSQYFFARVEGKAVFYNAFLQAPTYGGTTAVEPSPFVPTFQTGLHVGFRNGFFAVLTYSVIGTEWTSPVGDSGIQRYGGITIGYVTR